MLHLLSLPDNLWYGVSMTALALKLRAARGRSGMTQAELAHKAGIKTTVLQRIEAGAVKRPNAVTVARLAEALGTSLEALEGHPDRREGYHW